MVLKPAYFAVLVGLLSGINSWGQSLAMDTVFLDEHTVSGISYDQYHIGSSIAIRPDSILSQSLTNALEENAAIYFRQYGGEGQLSTINLRGLGSSRSSLLWNGIEINSFTLGQSDFNLIDVSNSQQIQLNKGSGGSLYGNGALGGSVEIQHLPDFSDITELSINQTIGSFGKIGTSAGFKHGRNGISTSTTVSYKSIDNDFEYEHRGEKFRQTGASYNAINAAHDFYLNLQNRDLLGINIWYNYNDRDIQQAKGDFSDPDHLTDHSLRSSVKYINVGDRVVGEYQLGYTYDHQVYNDGTPLRVSRGFARLEWEKESDKTSFKFGVNNNLIHVESGNFGKVFENRNDLFFSVAQRISPRLRAVINLREPVVKGRIKPFSPSLNGEYTAFDNENTKVLFNTQLSRSFRIPTINDRYWSPGGNPNLKPELSWNAEVGAQLNCQIEGVSLRYLLSGFYHDVDDWIIWVPGGSGVDENGNEISFWYPSNVRRVVASGIESSVTMIQKIGDITFNISANGAYTKSINKVAISQFDRSVGKQLPYTPQLVANARLDVSKKSSAAFLVLRYTGERFVEANNELPPMPAYGLIDIGIRRSFELKHFKLLCSGSIRNALNKAYENFENRAMPGRGFELNMNIKF